MIVRDHVLAGRIFDSTRRAGRRLRGWLPIRRAQVHRTHGEVIGSARRPTGPPCPPLPERPYLVTDRHLRQVGKDCLVSFESQLLLGARPAASAPGTGRAAASTAQEVDHPHAGGRGRWLLATAPRRPARGSLGSRPVPLGRAARRAHPRHLRAARRTLVAAGARRMPRPPVASAARRDAASPSPPDPWPTMTCAATTSRENDEHPDH